MTFLIEREDHTLGNALRYIMAKRFDISLHLDLILTLLSLDVEFCGYSVPHPTEHRMNIRVQTTGIPATQALRTSLQTLISMSDHLKSTYNVALEEYESRR